MAVQRATAHKTPTGMKRAINSKTPNAGKRASYDDPGAH